jgi:hypothetical protein
VSVTLGPHSSLLEERILVPSVPPSTISLSVTLDPSGAQADCSFSAHKCLLEDTVTISSVTSSKILKEWKADSSVPPSEFLGEKLENS